jgi:hypothetical protein
MNVADKTPMVLRRLAFLSWLSCLSATVRSRLIPPTATLLQCTPMRSADKGSVQVVQLSLPGFQFPSSSLSFARQDKTQTHVLSFVFKILCLCRYKDKTKTTSLKLLELPTSPRSKRNRKKDKDKLSSRQRLLALLYTSFGKNQETMALRLLIPPKTRSKDYLLLCLLSLVFYLAKARAKTCRLCYQIRMERQCLCFCLFCVLLDIKDKDKTKN